MTVFSVDECWRHGWQGPAVLTADASGVRVTPDAAPEGHLAGTVMPGLRDAHGHLALIDARHLLTGGIAAVDDLGGNLDAVATASADPSLAEVRFAGAFITPVGGYPSDRPWMPPGGCVEVDGIASARAAVDTQVDAGAAFIKVMLNSAAGPVFDDDTLAAIVVRAHDRGVTVIAHAEGVGEAARTLGAGIDRLAHTPFTEPLSDALLSAMADRQTWVSTLDIHGWGAETDEFGIALDNLRRFRALGGAVLYGTDLGNGPLPVGLNERELRALQRAGIDGDVLIDAIAPHEFGRRLSHTPSTDRDDTVALVMSTRVLDHHRIKEMLT